MKRVIALTNQALIEKIYEVAKLDHRNTGAGTMRLLIELGLESYERSGTLACIRRPGCQRLICVCREPAKPGDGERGQLLWFPASPA